MSLKNEHFKTAYQKMLDDGESGKITRVLLKDNIVVSYGYEDIEKPFFASKMAIISALSDSVDIKNTTLLMLVNVKDLVVKEDEGTQSVLSNNNIAQKFIIED